MFNLNTNIVSYLDRNFNMYKRICVINCLDKILLSASRNFLRHFSWDLKTIFRKNILTNHIIGTFCHTIDKWRKIHLKHTFFQSIELFNFVVEHQMLHFYSNFFSSRFKTFYCIYLLFIQTCKSLRAWVYCSRLFNFQVQEKLHNITI